MCLINEIGQFLLFVVLLQYVLLQKLHEGGGQVVGGGIPSDDAS